MSTRHTQVEVRRSLPRLLAGGSLATAGRVFAADWRRMQVVELDETTCQLASTIAETTGARTLDALHLAAATRVGANALTVLTTTSVRHKRRAALGMTVVGA